MKTNQLLLICLTIYLCVFTGGCWRTVDNALNYYMDSQPAVEAVPTPKVENPILNENLPQLFIIPTPNMQEQNMPAEEEDNTPKTVA